MEHQSGSKPAKRNLGELVGFIPRTAEFVKEAWQELKKVHWPTRQETQSATIVVVVVVLVMALFLGLVDFALSYAMQYLMNEG